MDSYDGIYEPGPIKPIVHIKQNLAIFTGGAWDYRRVEFIEPIPRSLPSVVDMVTVAGVTAIAANGTIQKQVVAALQLDEGEFLHLRWEPLDNVQGVLWEKAGQNRFATANLAAFVDRMTKEVDPYLATTTFWIIGLNRDMNLEVRNPMQYAVPAARFAFHGYRYILSPSLIVEGTTKRLLKEGDLQTVKTEIGAVTWVPAEGRVA